MVQQFSAIEEVAAEVQRRRGTDALNLGQIFCLGIEEVRARLGPRKWDRAADLIRKIMDGAIRETLDVGDCFMRTRDGSYLVVFASGNPALAEGKAARIAQDVTAALFGEDDLSAVTVSHVVQSHAGLKAGEKRDPTHILDALIERAERRSILHRTETPDCQRDEDTEGAQHEAGSEAAASDPDEPGPHGSARPRISRSPRVQDALFKEFAELEQPEIGFGFRPVWSVRREWCSVFQCVPMRWSAIGGPLMLDHEVLDRTAAPAEFVELDLAALETGLLAHSQALRDGRRHVLTFNCHFETLSDSGGHRELVTLLGKAPTAIKRTIAMKLCGVPEGVPSSRLASLLTPLSESMNTMLVDIDPRRLREAPSGPLSRFRQVGISTAVIQLPRDARQADLTTVTNLAAAAGKLGMQAAVSGITGPRLLAPLAKAGVTFFTGTLFGGPYTTLPTPHRLPHAKLKSKLNAAMAEAKAVSFRPEAWSDVADGFGVAFCAMRVGPDGKARIAHVSTGFKGQCGYDPEDLVGAPAMSLCAGDEDARQARRFLETLRLTGEATTRIRILSKPRQPVSVELRGWRASPAYESETTTVFVMLNKCGATQDSRQAVTA